MSEQWHQMFTNAEEDRPYSQTIPIRVMEIEDFIRKIEAEGFQIVGLAAEKHTLEFIVEKR